MEEHKKPMGMVLGQMMHAMFMVLKKRAYKQTEENMTMEQVGLLFAISLEEHEVILKDMAERMKKDKSAILRMIDLLEKKELVRRVIDMKDRRKNHLMVTKKGDRVIDQHLKIEAELVRELEDGLTQSEIDTFFKVIQHLRNRAEQLNSDN